MFWVLVQLILWLGPLPAAAAPGFGPTELNHLLDQNPRTSRPIRTVAELVSALPEDLRRNFTLVFDSRSPFRTSISTRYPRVILFGDDARLTITFTGDPRKPGFNSIEWLAFEERTARFTAGARVLPAAREAHPDFKIDIGACVRCHGTDVRPINDAYPAWPGFYGAVHDTFPSQNKSTVDELRHFRNFVSTVAHQKNSVYQNLIFPGGSPVSPYLDPRSVDPKRPELDRNFIAFMPNTKFGVALTELNRKRLFRKLKASASFEQRKTEYLHELLECGPSRVEPERIERIERAVKLENAARIRRLDPHYLNVTTKLADMEELKFTKALAQLDWVAEQSGAGRRDWSMALEENSLAFFDGILSGQVGNRSFYVKEDLILELLSDLSAEDVSWAIYKQMRRGFDPALDIGTRLDLAKAARACERLRPLVGDLSTRARRLRLALLRSGRAPAHYAIHGPEARSKNEICRLEPGRRWATWSNCVGWPLCRIDDFGQDQVTCEGSTEHASPLARAASSLSAE